MERRITQDDMNAAARGLRMAGMSVAELEVLIAEHPAASPLFASRVIHEAAKQIRAAKLRMGASK
jgi:hypothetical protein